MAHALNWFLIFNYIGQTPEFDIRNMSKIQFFQEEDHQNIKYSKTKTRNICAQIFKDHQKDVDWINIIFCNDEYLLAINQAHLNHDYYTDIITFDYNPERVTSDIFISTDRVTENAIKVGVLPVVELYRVMFHGCIHLCGFGDKTEAEKKIMREKEDYYLSLIL